MAPKKLTIVGAGIGVTAVAAAQRARRAARLRSAVEGVADAIEPTRDVVGPAEPPSSSDEAHAPAHRHLAAPAPPPKDHGPPVVVPSPVKHRHGPRQGDQG